MRLDELPDDVLGLIGESLRDLPSFQLVRLLLSSKSPLKLVKFLSEVRLPSYIYSRSTLKYHLRVGPFSTLPGATTALLFIHSLQLLRSLDLSYVELDKAAVRLVGLCAPELLTLRLRRSIGAMKIFFLPNFETPKLQILDLWNTKCPKPLKASIRLVLNHIGLRCGVSLRELYFHLVEEGSKAGNYNYIRVKNDISLADAIECFDPHRKTLEVLCAPINQTEALRISELVGTMPALKSFDYPIFTTFVRELQLDYKLETLNQASPRLRAWAQKLNLPPHLTLQNMFEKSLQTDHDFDVYASLACYLRTVIYYSSSAAVSNAVAALFTKDLPFLGVTPTSFSLVEILSLAKYGTSATEVIKGWLQAGFDPTEPLPWHPERASAVHLAYAAETTSVKSVINLANQMNPVPAWVSKVDYARIKDRAGRTPLMYYLLRTDFIEQHSWADRDVIDEDGNTLLHYVFAAAFFTVQHDTARFYPRLKALLGDLKSKNWPHLLKQNRYGVSVPLLIASMARGPHASLSLFDNPESNKFFWSCTTVEEPILCRILSFREDVTGQNLASNPLAGFLKTLLKSSSSINLNDKCFGDKKCLPLLHAVVEYEAVWILKVLQELPEVVKLIDVDAVDVNGCTALHYAVGPRKDSVFSTPELVQILLTLGLSPTITDKRGWTPAMRIVNNKECLKIIGAVLTPEERKRQSELYLQKIKEKQTKK